MFTGIKNALKSSGHLLMEVYSTEQLKYRTGGPPVEELLYTPQEFLDTFSGWHVPHFFFGEADRTEGRLHRGLGHLIQFIARKP